MVPGRADPPLARPGPLAAGGAAALPCQSAGHAGRSRFVRRVGALPHLRRRPLLPDLHRREAIWPNDHRRCVGCLAARLPQLSRDQRPDRRRVVRSRASEQQRIRPVAVPRRRRPQVPAQHAVGPPAGAEPLRRHRPAGVLGRTAAVGGGAPHDLQRHRDRLHRGAAPVQARRLVSPAHRGGRHGLGTRRDDGAVAQSVRSLRTAPGRARADRARSPRRGAAAHGPCGPRRDPGRGDLHGVSVRTSARQSGTLHAWPRNRDSADDVGRRRMAAYGRWSWASGDRGASGSRSAVAAAHRVTGS